MLSERIKACRKKHGLTQKQLADKLGVTQTAVSSWETGVRKPGIDVLEIIADALGESIYDFIPNNIVDTVKLKEEAVDAADAEYDDESYSEVAGLVEAAELAADTAMFRKLEKVPDQYLLHMIIHDFKQMNKLGKYKLFKYAELMFERDDSERFTL